MKKIYSVAAKIVRWMVTCVLSFIIAIPAIISLITNAQDRSSRTIEVSYYQPSQPQP